MRLKAERSRADVPRLVFLLAREQESRAALMGRPIDLRRCRASSCSSSR
jgi:hypothetical protein